MRLQEGAHARDGRGRRVGRLPLRYQLGLRRQPRDLFAEALVVSTFGLMSVRLRNALNLTADQQTKIAASREKFRQAYKKLLAPGHRL